MNEEKRVMHVLHVHTFETKITNYHVVIIKINFGFYSVLKR